MVLRTLVFHVPWLLLAGYGVILLARPLAPRREPARRAPAPPPSVALRGAGPPGAGPRPPGGLGWWLALAGTTCLALALRLYELGQRSLWLDEAISVWHARHPWGALLPTLASHDESPPLYFALLHLWRGFGEGEAALRVLSVLCAVLAVPLAAALGTALGGRGAGLLAALFIALSPVQVHHGQEARMYSLVTTLTLAASYGALRALRPARPVLTPSEGALPRPAGPPSGGVRPAGTPMAQPGGAPSGGDGKTSLVPAVAWGAILAALASTHHTAGLAGAGVALAAVATVATGVIQRRGRITSDTPGGVMPPGAVVRTLAVAGITGAVLWAPVAPLLVAQSRLVAAHYWIPPPRWEYVLNVLLDASVGSLPLPRHVQISDPITVQRPPDVLPALFALPRVPPLRHFSVAVAEGGTQLLFYVGALLLLGIGVARRRCGPAGVLLPLGAVLVPVLALLLISQVRPLLLARALVGSGAVSLVLIAVAAGALHRAVRVPVVGAVVTVLVLGLGQYWWYPALEDWRTAAQHLATQAHEGDLVLINGRWTQLPLDYYLSRYPALPALRIEERGVPLDFAARGKPEPVMTEADLPRLAALTRGRARAWLILSHSFDTDPRGLTRKALEADFPCFDVWPYQGVALHLFTRC